MSEFSQKSCGDKLYVEEDWNNLLEHGLEKCAGHILRIAGGVIQSTDGSTGKIEASGTDLAILIDLIDDGSLIFLKDGTFSSAGTVTLEHFGTNLIGSGYGATNIVCTTFNVPIISVKANRVRVSGMNIGLADGETPLDGNVGISVDPAGSIYDVQIDHVRLNNVYDAIYFGTAYSIEISHSRIETTLHDGIIVGGANDQYVHNVIMNGHQTASGGAGIHCLKTGGLWVNNVDVINFYNGFKADPTTGNTVAWIWMNNVAFDAQLVGGDGIYLTRDNGGVVEGLHFLNGWCSGFGGHGIYAKGVDKMVLTNIEIQDNTKSGVVLDAACYYAKIVGCHFANAATKTGYYGVFVQDGVHMFRIQGNTFLPSSWSGSIKVATGSQDHYIVKDNMAFDGISDGGTGIDKVVSDNLTVV